MSTTKDLVGQVFDRLTVISRAENSADSQAQWNCRCVCGGTAVVKGGKLRSGHSRSCGCLGKERRAESTTKHRHTVGGKWSPTYYSWASMLARCETPSATGYQRYGASGIKVCERWHEFINFLADMGERPNGTSIDRYPNNNGNYEPGNCRWATRKQQGRNQVTNLIVTVKGRKVLLKDLAEITGIKYDTLRSRIFRKGWSVKRSLEKRA